MHYYGLPIDEFESLSADKLGINNVGSSFMLSLFLPAGFPHSPFTIVDGYSRQHAHHYHVFLT
jgi:hypothetical protein